VGPAIEVTNNEGTSLHNHLRIRERNQQSLFGEVKVSRTGYGKRGSDSIYPLDEALELPARSFSYSIQRYVVKHSVQGPFDEGIKHVEEFTGVGVPKRSAEEIVVEAAQDFEDFYKQKVGPPSGETGPILVASVDGKGIPMKKPETHQAPGRRLKKGEKANKKKMATVAAVYTMNPRVRTPQDVVKSLFRHLYIVEDKDAKEAEKRERPQHKRVWASLEKGKDGTIKEVCEEVERRDPVRVKIRVGVTDGERALQIRVPKLIPGILLILDLLHVLEKLWKVAYVFYAEGSSEAEQWVKDHILSILEGNISQVIKGIRQSATKRGIKGSRLKTLKNVSAYYYRNRKFMRYNEYLEQGLPIASGSVEGACKNLIKDRMERSGMRWSPRSAEAMLKMRATYLSGDFDEYWHFHVARDQERQHPQGLWKPLEVVVQK
jgi:hypothetical protein